MREAAVYGAVTFETADVERAHLVAEAERYAEEVGFDITQEIFDVRFRKPMPWVQRSQAQRLLRFVADPRCRIEAVVVPEPLAVLSKEDVLTASVLLGHRDVELHLVPMGVVPLQPTAARRMLAQYGSSSDWATRQTPRRAG